VAQPLRPGKAKAGLGVEEGRAAGAESTAADERAEGRREENGGISRQKGPGSDRKTGGSTRNNSETYPSLSCSNRRTRQPLDIFARNIPS
jgi:hypothetical protein